MAYPIHVKSEIGKLKTVLLKRPGREVENLTPDTMERLLFDDIPFFENIQKEHDYFADTLRKEGVEVLYLEKLAAESLVNEEVKQSFLKQMIDESGLISDYQKQAVIEYLGSMNNDQMIEKIMAGIRKHEVEIPHQTCLDTLDDYPFLTDPMPNLYFTRDPIASIGNGLTVNRMTFAARQRESLFIETIMNYHPRFADSGIQVWLDRYTGAHIEGGDELVLSDTVLAVGISQRTSAHSIKLLAEKLFKNNSGYEKVLAIKIPNNRAMMHLDTVFTMVDYDKFTIHPAILDSDGKMDVYVIEKANNELGMTITLRNNIEDVLKEVLNLSELVLIPTGRGDAIVAPREQWNDGSNTLAIAPGTVVTYDRNYVSNEVLREYGLRVLEVLSGELSRGRGGPRCMSQPLVREDLK
ncbi:arginine deiminase [Pilibacter termitis]|uniref:Arginine deiminase n=1 Tax=Pilibacter termitis TaxID=263852 RepID=A0A1T4L516_9ENTE|nr:arginine deiminase [Pilibacter termitis]SJZ49816.1 arginine deiminase [Pilibacter termitis]